VLEYKGRPSPYQFCRQKIQKFPHRPSKATTTQFLVEACKKRGAGESEKYIL